jgi:membrane protein implicated in regulation of membrane protease activity
MEPYILWLAAGLLLMALEMASGAFVLLPIGLGAASTGILLWARVPLSLSAQLAVFGALSVAALWLLRPFLKRWLQHAPDSYNEHAGQTVVVESTITHAANGSTGTVKYRGSSWQARAAEPEQSFAPGSTPRIDSVDGIVLVLRN